MAPHDDERPGATGQRVGGRVRRSVHSLQQTDAHLAPLDRAHADSAWWTHGTHRNTRLDDRDHRRRVRLAARLLDGALPRLRAAGHHDLRPERQPGGHLPAVRVQPRPDRAALGVRVALPPRRLADVRASSTPGRTAASRRSGARSGASTTPASRRSWPRPASSAAAGLGRRRASPTRVGWLQRELGGIPRTSSSTTSRRTASAARST